jgi:hypothetical protein
MGPTTVFYKIRVGAAVIFARLLTFSTFPTEKLTAVPARRVDSSRKRAVNLCRVNSKLVNSNF